jgi:hypothetical protein
LRTEVGHCHLDRVPHDECHGVTAPDV